MAVDVETLVVRLEGRISDFERSMLKAQRSAQTSANKIAGTFAAMNKKLVAAFKFGGAFLGVSALSQIPKVIKNVVDEAGELVDTAQKIGITTDQLQELQFAAKQTGVEVTEMTAGLSFFARQLGEASRGQGELLEILKANNVALRDSEGNLRPIVDLLGDYAELVQNAGSQEEKAILVTKALGRANDELIVTFDDGREGLIRFSVQARKTGQIVDKDLLAKAEVLGDRWDELMGTLEKGFKSFVLTITVGTAEALGELNKLLTKRDDQAAKQVEIDRQAEVAQNIQIRSTEAVVQLEEESLRLTQQRTDLLAEIARLSAISADPALIATLERALEDVNIDLAATLAGIERISGAAAALAAGKPIEAGGGGDTLTNVPIPTLRPSKPTIIPGTGAGAKADATERVIENLRFESEQLRRTARDQEIYNALNQAGVDISSKAGEAIAAQAGANFDLAESIQRSIEQAEFFRDIAGEAFRGVADALEDGRIEAEELGNILQNIARMLLDKGLQLLLTSLLGGSGTTLGGTLGTALAGFFGGARAAGGPVQAGRGYKVGEHGTELFVPSVSGRIHPASGGSMHGVVELVLTDEIDARIRRVSGPQSEKIAISVTRANSAIQARQQELKR